VKRLALIALIVIGVLAATTDARAQSPELSLREFASGQIKKGVRSIGFGGDGATWGNYGLVYRDAGTALVDGGATGYTNGNLFWFTAVGATSPDLWRGLVIYAIALSQTGRDIHLPLQSPGLGTGPVAVHGDGSNQALFLKLAMPLPKGFAIGLLLSYESSQFTLATDASPTRTISYKTNWLPSGGIGLAWQPDVWQRRLLVGVRAILNHDNETRTDPSGPARGLARSYEFRAGASISPWKGALVDAGMTVLDRANGIAGTEKVAVEPNVGFEQAFRNRAFVMRVGLDESTIGGGVSIKVMPVNLDVAYLYNLGAARIGTLFGTESHSVLATLTLDYGWLYHRRAGSSGPPAPLPPVTPPAKP
jgi:hypothetical protein